MHHGWGQTPQQALAQERQVMQSSVAAQFERPMDRDSALYKAMHGDSAIEHVYGGEMSAQPQEEDLVQAWRPGQNGEWQLGTGVVHRVHQEDRTVTVQFVPDQGRYRLPFMSIKKLSDITPEYPTIRLRPGQRLPTPSEIVEREHRANVQREVWGIANDQALPGSAADDAFLPGETKGKDGMVTIRAQNWGIPAPTLEALRNRSVPCPQVTGEYGRHFYTDLYKQNFYAAQGQSNVLTSGPVQSEHAKRGQQMQKPKARVVGHTYIQADGQVLEQNLATGKWHIPAECEEDAEPHHSMPESAWFLG